MLKRVIASAVLTAVVAVPSSALASVRLSISEGRVWLVADQATIAEILAEWARVGHTQMVNVERVSGPRLTLDLRGIPQLDALDIILRSVGGFVTVSRDAGLGDSLNLSQFSRVVIVPSTGGPANPTLPPVSAAVPAPQPPSPIQAPVFSESGGQRLIGPDGQPIPDDQEDAPQPPPRTLPTNPRGTSMPPGSDEPPDASSKKPTVAPGRITPPVKPPPRPPGAELPQVEERRDRKMI
jgi:hypothetical protein